VAHKRKNQVKKSGKGHNCAGKSFGATLIGASLNFTNRDLNGVGSLKNGNVLGDEGLKAFSQWKWTWKLLVEFDLQNEAGDVKCVKQEYYPKGYMNIFDLEDVLLEYQVVTLISESNYKFLGKRWQAVIMSSPV